MASDSANSKQEPAPLRERFAVKMTCSKCGQVGSITWEENSRVSPRGPMTELLGISNGFYMRVRKSRRGSSQIVCAVCDTAQPD